MPPAALFRVRASLASCLYPTQQGVPVVHPEPLCFGLDSLGCPDPDGMFRPFTDASSFAHTDRFSTIARDGDGNRRCHRAIHSRDTHPDETSPRIPSRHSNTDSYAQANEHAYARTDAYSHAHAATDGYTDPETDGHTYTNSYPAADTHPTTDRDANAQADGHA